MIATRYGIGCLVPALAAAIFCGAPAASAGNIPLPDPYQDVSFLPSSEIDGQAFAAALNTPAPDPNAFTSFSAATSRSPLEIPFATPDTDYRFQTPPFATREEMESALPGDAYLPAIRRATIDDDSPDYTADEGVRSYPYLTAADFSELQRVDLTLTFTVDVAPGLAAPVSPDSLNFLTTSAGSGPGTLLEGSIKPIL